jgi:hypothetical protein
MDQPVIQPLERVEVRDRFQGRWAGEFEVAEVVTMADGRAGYLLRRLSDGARLPSPFTGEEVRLS